MRIIYRCGILVLCALGLSCSSPPHLGIYATETEWVDLREWPIGYDQAHRNAHPFSVSPTVLRDILRSVYYQESTLFSFIMGSARPVFTHTQVHRLSAEVSKALDLALPQEVVSFRIREHRNSSKFTKGFCFVRHNELHVIIESLRRPAFQSEETAPQPNLTKWQFEPYQRQRLFHTEANGKGRRPHWLVIPLDDTRNHDEQDRA